MDVWLSMSAMTVLAGAMAVSYERFFATVAQNPGVRWFHWMVPVGYFITDHQGRVRKAGAYGAVIGRWLFGILLLVVGMGDTPPSRVVDAMVFAACAAWAVFGWATFRRLHASWLANAFAAVGAMVPKA